VAGSIGREPDPQGPWHGPELDGRVQDQGLAVQADLDRLAGAELEGGVAPFQPARRATPVAAVGLPPGEPAASWVEPNWAATMPRLPLSMRRREPNPSARPSS
jgi:hypothetical protein